MQQIIPEISPSHHLLYNVKGKGPSRAILRALWNFAKSRCSTIPQLGWELGEGGSGGRGSLQHEAEQQRQHPGNTAWIQGLWSLSLHTGRVVTGTANRKTTNNILVSTHPGCRESIWISEIMTLFCCQFPAAAALQHYYSILLRTHW